MKQVKILKRPTTSPPPSKPTDRVSAEITAMLEGALSRERQRLESAYRARQDALLRAVSTVLNDSLETVVAAAVDREMKSLISNLQKPTSLTAPPTPAPDAAVIARDSFATAFERTALPAFEADVSNMLRALAANVELLVEERLLAPAAGVVHALEGAADSIRAVKTDIADMSADSDAADAALVQAALDEGNVRDAFMLCVGKSVAIRAKAVSGVLDLAVNPEDAFGSDVPPMPDLVKFAAVLSMELGDRTEARLTWLYEVVTMMDDAEEYDQASPEVIQSSRRRLEGTIERLREFQKNGAPGPTEAKHTKLLIRVLKAHLNAM